MGSKELGGKGIDNQTAKEKALESAKNYREFIKGQGASLQDWLADTGLGTVKVQEGTEIRDAKFFEKRTTVGYTASHDSSCDLVVFVSSALSDKSFSPLLIAPTEHSSSFIIDKQ